MSYAGHNPCLSSPWCSTNQICAKSQLEPSRELPAAQRKAQRHWHQTGISVNRDTDFISPIRRFHIASRLFSILKPLLRSHLMFDYLGPASSLFSSVFRVAPRAGPHCISSHGRVLFVMRESYREVWNVDLEDLGYSYQRPSLYLRVVFLLDSTHVCTI